ncbi:MAG: hypothetical protein ACK55I_18285, partial [bacterium]
LFIPVAAKKWRIETIAYIRSAVEIEYIYNLKADVLLILTPPPPWREELRLSSVYTECKHCISDQLTPGFLGLSDVEYLVVFYIFCNCRNNFFSL